MIVTVACCAVDDIPSRWALVFLSLDFVKSIGVIWYAAGNFSAFLSSTLLECDSLSEVVAFTTFVTSFLVLTSVGYCRGVDGYIRQGK